jgi:hypothetical protein
MKSRTHAHIHTTFVYHKWYRDSPSAPGPLGVHRLPVPLLLLLRRRRHAAVAPLLLLLRHALLLLLVVVLVLLLLHGVAVHVWPAVVVPLCTIGSGGGGSIGAW